MDSHRREGVKELEKAIFYSPAAGPFCGCYRPRLRLVMATTFDFLSWRGFFGPSLVPSRCLSRSPSRSLSAPPSSFDWLQAIFPAQADPLLNVVSEAGPQHLAADLLQAAHAKLPQPQLGLQPQIGELGHWGAQAVKGLRLFRLHLGHVLRHRRDILAALDPPPRPARLTELAKHTLPAILRRCLIDFPLHPHPITFRGL